MTVLKALPMTVTGVLSVVNQANFLTAQPGEKATATLTNVWGAGLYYAHTTFDLGSLQLVDQIAILYHDAPPGCFFQVVMDENGDYTGGDAIGTGVVDLTAEGGASRPNGYRHGIWNAVGAGIAPKRYVVLYIIGPQNTVVNIGRVMIGKAVQPEFNTDYGDTSFGYEEADEPELLDSGVEVLYEAVPAPVFQFSLSWGTEAEMNNDWEPLGRLQHEGTPVLVARRPDPHAYRHNGLFYGRLRMRPIVAADFDMYEVQGTVRSMV